MEKKNEKYKDSDGINYENVEKNVRIGKKNMVVDLLSVFEKCLALVIYIKETQRVIFQTFIVGSCNMFLT